jgi:peptidoglycan/LPS O-acetylase OafA/YrhL
MIPGGILVIGSIDGRARQAPNEPPIPGGSGSMSGWKAKLPPGKSFFAALPMSAARDHENITLLRQAGNRKEPGGLEWSMRENTDRMSRKHFAFNGNIHGCRGLFAGMVIIYHVENSGLSGGLIWDNAFVQYVAGSFCFGVELFFCISGYVISMSLMRTPTLSRFIEERLRRILPVAFFIQVLLFIGGTIIHDKQFDHIGAAAWIRLFASNALLLPGLLNIAMVNPPAWSLSYEVVFYIVASIFFYHGVKRNRPALIIAIIMVVVFLFDWYPRAIFFTIGIFAYLAEERFTPRTRHGCLVLFTGLAAFLLSWRTVKWLSAETLIEHMTILSWVADARIWLAGAAYISAGIFFFTMLHDNGIFGRLMKSRPLQYLGSISYSLYLWHPTIMYVTKRFTAYYVLPVIGPEWGKTVLLILSLPVAIAVSHASFIYLERRLTPAIQTGIAKLAEGRIDRRRAAG